MKVAVVGSRSITRVDLERFLPKDIDLIISGGARGVDTCAEIYARRHGIDTLIIRPDYGKYGSMAPLIRNNEIIEKADIVYVFWDGSSRGTGYVIRKCHSRGVPMRVFVKR